MDDHNSQRQVDNPVYDGSNYSLRGPSYEHVEANEETGYDVINRRGVPRPCPSITPTASHDSTLEQDYGTLEGNNYDVIQLRHMETHSDVVTNASVDISNDQSESNVSQNPFFEITV